MKLNSLVFKAKSLALSLALAWVWLIPWRWPSVFFIKRVDCDETKASSQPYERRFILIF